MGACATNSSQAAAAAGAYDNTSIESHLISKSLAPRFSSKAKPSSNGRVQTPTQISLRGLKG